MSAALVHHLGVALFKQDEAPVVSSSEGTAILGANEWSEFAPVV